MDPDSPGRRLRHAIEPLATIGYHASVALDAYEALGFDFVHGYTWARASSLGEPDAAVVTAAFGVWDTATIRAAYDAARARVDLGEMRRVRVQAASDSLREVLGDPADLDGLEDTTGALEDAVAACSTLGKPLFAGLVGHPRPADPLGRLWHAANSLREHRGDAHLAALVGRSVDGVEANLLNERRHGFAPFSFTATRHWSQDAMDAGLARLEARGLVTGADLTDRGRELMDSAEAATDAADQVVLDTLGADLDRHVDRLDAWSQRICDHGWYPDEPGKRDAG